MRQREDFPVFCSLALFIPDIALMKMGKLFQIIYLF